MARRFRALCGGALLSISFLAGCTDANVEMMTRDLATGDRDAVLAAAQKSLVEYFPRMNVDRQAYLILTEPSEFNTTRESGTSRDLVGAPSTMRHVARFGVAKSGDRSRARIRIDVERRDTTRREVVSPETARVSDSPAATPIERDAARSTRQNEVWTKVRRDAKLERSILDELEKQFAPPVVPREPAANVSK